MKKRMVARGVARLILPPVFLLAVLAGLSPGCGKKAPPFLPDTKLEIRVENLTGTWENGAVRLRGMVRDDHGELPRVTGCRVYLAWFPPDAAPCDGCPLRMKEFRAVKGKVVSAGGFNCEVPGVERKGRWYFFVRLTGTRNSLGPPSGKTTVIIR